MSLDHDQVVFGQRLRNMRRARGLSQHDLAFAAGLSRTSVANIEAGRQDTRVSSVILFARALRTTVGYLLGEEAPVMMARVADRQGELAEALAELTRRNQHVWACVEALIDVVDPVPGGDVDEAQGGEG